MQTCPTIVLILPRKNGVLKRNETNETKKGYAKIKIVLLLLPLQISIYIILSMSTYLLEGVK